jgi:hypothetical protein
MDGFEKNVFINCPFDEDYRQLMLAVIFTVSYLDYKPRLSLESSDSGKTRIDKILNLIKESKFGIHDLSRILSTDKEEHYRMNMPFELGIDYGCQKLQGGVWQEKKILILEKEKYRYQKALSDLSGSDIKNHDDDPIKIIKSVRDWFVTEDTEELGSVTSGPNIWKEFNDFNAFLYNKCVEEDGHESVDEIPVKEIIHLMKIWFTLKEKKS